MKLQGDNSTSTKDMSKVFFPVLHKSRVAPEQNGGIVGDRHLESEEGSCEKGIISRILKKVGALGQGTYSPLRRSKSQDRISTSLPITTFFSKNVQPVLKTYKNVSSSQNYKTGINCDARRFSHSDVLSNKSLQLSKQSKDDFTKTKFYQSDKKLSIPNTECAFQDNKNSPETSKIETTNAPKTKINQKENEKTKSKVISGEKINETKENVPTDNAKNKDISFEILDTSPLKDDSKNRITSSENVIISGNVEGAKIAAVDGITRIQIKYSAPVIKDKLNDDSDNLEKNKAPGKNSDLKLSQVEPSKNNISDSKCTVSTVQISHQVEKPIISSSSTSSLSPSSSSLGNTSPPLSSSTNTSYPSSSLSNTSYPSSLWSLRASSSSAKSLSKSNPGKMTIRPASNLNASKLKSEFLKLTEFNDIKIGEFSAPAKPKKQTKVEAEKDGDDDDDDDESFEFIGAGVIQGKSILAKAKSSKRRSVNFNEAPVVHVIDSTCGGGDDNDGGDGGSDADDDYDKFSSNHGDGFIVKIFSSPATTITKGSLSSYKAKSLADFDFDDPPMMTQSNHGPITCREQVFDVNFQSDEKPLWSSNNNIDLLF